MRSAAPILLACLATPVLAQPQPTRVEQGVGDVDPARSSLRALSRDLRAPTGFESVYRFDRVDAFGNVQRNFMRIDGATYAVFPRSQYITTPAGTVAAIPAGTMFYIGGLPRDWSARPASRQPPPSMISRAIDTRLPMRAVSPMATSTTKAGETPPSATPAEARPAPRVPPSIYEDDAYRRKRLNELLANPRPAPRTAPSRKP